MFIPKLYIVVTDYYSDYKLWDYSNLKCFLDPGCRLLVLTTYKTLMVMAGWRCHDGMCTYKVQLQDPIAAPVAVLLIRRCV